MATYLQGVTDFIPDYQPFQPDFNFYANLLQAKQSQYDSNWKQLNNLYGSLYGADLTHDQNIKKKDELLKQIDFNLKRVSGLDLSLEQNVNQAMQVFKPFYEDRFLMKDMAWTKNWKNTYNSANALKTSQDEKQRKQWWGTGIQGLELRRQMFKDATLEETLNMGNVTYTPFVNAVTEYMDLAKKYDIGAVQQLPDESGLYLVRKKNGELILPTLQNMFIAEYANRPDIQDMYREAAFVERMNYANQNAEKFGGSKLEAEKEYIKTKYEWLKNYSEDRNNKAQDELNTTKNIAGAVDNDIKQGNVNPQQVSYIDRLNQGLKVNTIVANETEKLNNQINDKQSTSTVKGFDEDILADLDLARLKVDAGFASVAAEQDIMRAANSYASRNQEIEYKPNAVGLEFLRHKHASQRQRQAHNDRLDEIQKQNENKIYQKAIDYNVSKGYWSFDQNGKLNTNPQSQGFNINFLTPGDAGQSTDGKFSLDALNEMMRNQMIDQNATEPVTNLMTMLQNAINAPNGSLLTAAEIAQYVTNFDLNNPLAKKILKEGSKNYLPQIKKVWNSIWEQYKNDPTTFIREKTQSGSIYNVNRLLRNWSTANSGLELARVYNSDQSMIKLEQLSRTDDALNVIRNQNYDKIRDKFRKDLNYITKKVKEKDPETYKNVTQDKIDQAVNLMMTRYILDGKGHTEEFDKIASRVDAEISSILGFSIGKTTNRKAETSWYNYVFPLTNIPRMLGSGRETVKDKASWVSDVFDQSFDELTKLDPDKGGLKTYFPNATRKSGTGNEYGLAAETGNIMVAPGVYWDPGNESARQMFNSILATNWNNDRNKYRITTGGNVLPGSDEEWEDTGISQNEATAIVRELQAQLNTNKELKPFAIGASTISMENADLGSMKLMAPREVIEKVIKSMAGEDVSENDIKTKIDNIYQNGITFIAPKPVFSSNKLFGNQFETPTEVLLSQGPIKFSDPNGNGGYVIEKIPGSSGYRGAGTFYEMRPDGSKIQHERYFDLDSRSGKLIGDRELQLNQLIYQSAQMNLEMFRRIHQSGNQEALQKAQQNFGASVNNPFWNYNK
jgi:hypothetical protein